MTTLAEFKAAFAQKCLDAHQRGPNDYSGYERDAEMHESVRRARSWGAIAENPDVPTRWAAAAANRCLPWEL